MSFAYDFGKLQVKVDGRIISNLGSAQIPEIAGAQAAEIMAGGGRVTAHATRSLANGTAYEFSTPWPSTDDRFLWEVSQSQREVTLEVTYTDPTDLPDGAWTGFKTSGRLHAGGSELRDEPGERVYTHMGIGYTATFKNTESITVR